MTELEKEVFKANTLLLAREVAMSTAYYMANRITKAQCDEQIERAVDSFISKHAPAEGGKLANDPHALPR